MKYREIKNIKVSEIGMGCWAIGGNQFGNSYGHTDDVESLKAVKKALELGCNFFDTADVYGHGHSEELLGLALGRVREKVIIATKVGGAYMYNDSRWGHVNFSPEYIEFALEQSLRRLKTNYIDIYQLHNPSLKMIKEGEVFKPLRKLQKEGKIKLVGVSVHSLDEGVAALEHADVIQCVFNMIDPRNYELLESAKRMGIGIIVREPLANGFLSGKFDKESKFEQGDIRSRMPSQYVEELTALVEEIEDRFKSRLSSVTLSQIALRYILMFDSVSTVIPGAKTEWQVEQNMKASGIAPLTEQEMAILGS
ncbi:MAG: aldo/keto reductase [Candidatus Aenigmarchaeota archaeon]|nr:aldo/keto reductase [Candidatus Aenigmarchaeota archaeon]